MATNTQTVAQWLSLAVSHLSSQAITESPQLDAQLIACQVLDKSRAQLYAFPETRLSADDQSALEACLARRLSGEPIAYICGCREFWSMNLTVKPGTLVPRADTEILVEQALRLVESAPQGALLDLGTGTGAIACALATELPQRHIVAIERSEAALAVARMNVEQYAKHNLSLIQGQWMNSLEDNSMAMIVSNPPYLGSADTHLDSLAHEPRDALVSGITGTEDLQHIIEHSVRVGKNGAPLLLEHGSEQGAQVRHYLLEHHYQDVGTVPDLAGLERVSVGIISKTVS